MTHAQVLTDAARHVAVANWQLTSDDLGPAAATAGRWSVVKRTLRGGRQEGVEVIEVDNGTLRFSVVPTRGCGIWWARTDDLRLGWDSPVREIVHPQFVRLAERGGRGWLDGFGGWLVRCGLESVGAPALDGDQPLTLHGRVDYLPASYVEVRYEAGPPPRLVVRGIVDETAMFGPQLRLTTEISTEIGRPVLRLDDAVTNLADAPQEMQSLYHVNYGPPLLGAGAEFVAPVRRVAPRDARAAEGGMAGWNRYAGPQPPGYREQVYLAELFADEAGETRVLLRSADGARGAEVGFNVRELPFLTLWKNEASAGTGYVTGIEPGTGYPHPRPVERRAGRVPVLAGGQTHRARLRFGVLGDRPAVEAAAAAVQRLQRAAPEVSLVPAAPVSL